MLDIVLMTAQLVWLAKNTIQAGSGNPIIEASSIAICAIYFTNQVHTPRALSVRLIFTYHLITGSCCVLLRRRWAVLSKSNRGRKAITETCKAVSSSTGAASARWPGWIARAMPLIALTFSEEIAFYKGEKVEERRIMESFQGMLKQIMKVRSHVHM